MIFVLDIVETSFSSNFSCYEIELVPHGHMYMYQQTIFLRWIYGYGFY